MSFYAFNYTQPTFLNNTIFAHYKVINKSGGQIDSLHIGMWEDPDLGCYNDDYIGSSPQNNTMFCYNADAYDDVVCSNGGAMGYGANIPVLATTFLDRPMAKTTYYINNTPPQPPPGQSNPAQSYEYYNYLSGSWRDGSRVIGSGDGYNLDSTNYVNHVFTDDPRTPNGWSLYALLATPRDYRIIGSAYYPTWQPQEAKELTMAFSTHKGGDNLASLGTMYTDLPALQTFFDNNYQAGGLLQNTILCTGNCVYPGDANLDGTVNTWDYLYPATSYNNTGATRADKSSNFYATSATDWTSSLANNVNKKHLDCDGNGVANVNDMTVITQNLSNAITCVTPPPANWYKLTAKPSDRSLTLASTSSA